MDRDTRKGALGRIRWQAGLLAALLVLAPLGAGAAIFTVNTTDDDSDSSAGNGSCSTGTVLFLGGTI
ncbi:MAG: hypothetical protein AAGC67_11145, partial [Myxococcota bacterium]